MFRKILGWFVLVILIAGSICGITFGALYFNQKESTTSETGSMEQTIDFLEKELTAIKKQRQELQESLSNTTAQRDALQLQYDAKVEELRVALIDSAEDKELISTLQSQVAELETELAEKTAKVSELEGQVDQLEADKLALQNEVTRLTALLAGYEEIANSTVTADFYIGDTLYTTKVVKSGQAVAGLENPVDTNEYRFNGWTIDGTTPVDVATYSIEENTIFKALLTEKHEVKFVANGEVVSTQYILDGEVASAVEDPTLEGGEFRGWYLDDPSVYVDVSTIAIESDITLTAYFATWQKIFSSTKSISDGGTLTVDGLLATDQFRVTIKRINLRYSGTNYYVCNSEDEGGYAVNNGSDYAQIVIGSDEIWNKTMVMTTTSGGTADITFTISFSCETDGILKVSADKEGGYIHTVNVTILSNVTINCIEVLR